MTPFFSVEKMTDLVIHRESKDIVYMKSFHSRHPSYEKDYGDPPTHQKISP